MYFLSRCGKIRAHSFQHAILRLLMSFQSGVILAAGALKRSRKGFSEFSVAAHLHQCVHVGLAFAWFRESRVIRPGFVDRLAIQIREPCFDIPCRHHYSDGVAWCMHVHADGFACFVQLSYTSVDAESVAIEYHHQSPIDVSKTVSLQFSGKTLPHVLLSGATSRRCLLHAHGPCLPTGCRQESPDERFVLRVFTQKNELNGSLHNSHPLATISESLRPESPWSAMSSFRGRTETTPRLSRFSMMPASYPK